MHRIAVCILGRAVCKRLHAKSLDGVCNAVLIGLIREMAYGGSVRTADERFSFWPPYNARRVWMHGLLLRLEFVGLGTDTAHYTGTHMRACPFPLLLPPARTYVPRQ